MDQVHYICTTLPDICLMPVYKKNFFNEMLKDCLLLPDICIMCIILVDIITYVDMFKLMSAYKTIVL